MSFGAELACCAHEQHVCLTCTGATAHTLALGPNYQAESSCRLRYKQWCCIFNELPHQLVDCIHNTEGNCSVLKGGSGACVHHVATATWYLNKAQLESRVCTRCNVATCILLT